MKAVSKPKPTKSPGTWTALEGAEEAMERVVAEAGDEEHAADEAGTEEFAVGWGVGCWCGAKVLHKEVE